MPLGFHSARSFVFEFKVVNSLDVNCVQGLIVSMNHDKLFGRVSKAKARAGKVLVVVSVGCSAAALSGSILHFRTPAFTI